MTGAVHNFKRGWSFQSTLVILVALLVLVLLMGVTLAPMVRVQRVRDAHQKAERRAAELESKWASLRDFEVAGGFEAAHQGTELVRAMLPEEYSTIELHSAVRLAATAARLELDSVSPGDLVELRPSGFPGLLPDRVLQRDVHIAGIGSVRALVELVDGLKAHGYPTTMLDLALHRESPDEDDFQVRATLGLFHRSGRVQSTGQSAADLQEAGVEGNSKEE